MWINENILIQNFPTRIVATSFSNHKQSNISNYSMYIVKYLPNMSCNIVAQVQWMINGANLDSQFG